MVIRSVLGTRAIRADAVKLQTKVRTLTAERQKRDERDEETRVKEREEHSSQVENEAVGIFITENVFFKSFKYHNTMAVTCC